MKRLMTALMASALAASMTVPAGAQSYYDRNQSYNDRTSQYDSDRAAYDAQVADYNRAREQYERDRDRYDRRYGRGAYERQYGAFNRDYPRAYVDSSATVPAYGSQSASCAQARSDAKGGRAAGTILGALIGGAVGSNIAAGGHRSDGTVLGAVVGGVIGNKVGGNTNAGRYAAACDSNGYYYSYDQTYPYREGRQGVPRGRYDSRYYADRNCRLAPAETETGEYRYIRVCPDANGRYRVTT